MPQFTERRVVVAVAAVIAVATTALAAVAVADSSDKGQQLTQLTGQQQLRESVLATGRQIAVDFASYDYRHIDADFSRVAGEATGNFKKQFVTQAAGVRGLIVKAKAVSTAQIASEGLVDVAATTATIVVALDRTVHNTSAPKGQQDSFGLEVDLVKQGGRWLASGVKPL